MHMDRWTDRGDGPCRGLAGLLAEDFLPLRSLRWSEICTSLEHSLRLVQYLKLRVTLTRC